MRSRVALLATATAVALAAPAVAAAPVPVLRLVHGQPLVLAGAHFKGHERITVTVHARQPYLRRVTARANGSFSVSFGMVSVARCGGLMADAVGASGRRASVRIPRQACVQPPGTD